MDLPRLCLALVFVSSLAQAAQVDTLTIESQVLRGNPLGDPTRRWVAVVSPDEVAPAEALPLVLYLPGWGSSSEETISAGSHDWLAAVVDSLAAKGQRLRIVSVDARSRYGGSQYLNSTATGEYADFVTDEVVTATAAKYRMPPSSLYIAGHSSGGYGALVLALQKPAVFAAVVALSPDSDFETTHKPLAQNPAVRALSLPEVERAMTAKGGAVVPGGLPGLIVGLSANYAPAPGQHGRFDWLYDAHGTWRPEVWARWVASDPLTQMRQRTTNTNDSIQGRYYMDGASLDEFGANIGARKMVRALEKHPCSAEFYEAPGHHAEHLAERLTRGLLWALK